MKDLTKDSISVHILTLAAPVIVSMFAQFAYQLVDLYFIAQIGAAATAGVNVAANLLLVFVALTQVVIVGTTPLVAQAVGRKDQADANLVFNQSMALSVIIGLVTTAFIYSCTRPYLRWTAADAVTTAAGVEFVSYVLPGLAVLLPMAALGSALRGTGSVQPYIAISMLTVLINAALAPILIAGWGTGTALGVRGAGMATSISIATGMIVFAAYVYRYERYLTLKRTLLHPRPTQWRRISGIGLPASAELVLVFASTAFTYYVIRDFGASAQAGFGIGSRVLYTILLPAMAIGFAAGPIAAQNFGAQNGRRVQQTFNSAAVMGSAITVATTAFVQYRPEVLLSVFHADGATLHVATQFLQLTSWAFVAQGLIYLCSNMFQSLGNTLPSLISSTARLLAFSIPIIWLSTRPQFDVAQVWYLFTASTLLQAAISLWLFRIEFRRLVAPLQWREV
jgi:putative MATE family efflux protein